jgi:hypothetical protein
MGAITTETSFLCFGLLTNMKEYSILLTDSMHRNLVIQPQGLSHKCQTEPYENAYKSLFFDHTQGYFL